MQTVAFECMGQTKSSLAESNTSVPLDTVHNPCNNWFVMTECTQPWTEIWRADEKQTWSMTEILMVEG